MLNTIVEYIAWRQKEREKAERKQRAEQERKQRKRGR